MSDETPVTNPTPEPEVPAQYKGKTFADLIKIVEDTKSWANTRLQQEAEKLATEKAKESAASAVALTVEEYKAKATALTAEYQKAGRLSEKSKEEAKALGLDDFLTKVDQKFGEVDKYNMEQIVNSIAQKTEYPPDMVKRILDHVEKETASDPKARDAFMSSIKSGKTGLFTDYAQDYIDAHTKTLKGSFTAPVLSGGLKDEKELQAAIRQVSKTNYSELLENLQNSAGMSEYLEQKIAALNDARDRRMMGKK